MRAGAATALWLALRLASGGAALAAAAEKAPHVLFILVDDLGWANVGFHQPDDATAAPEVQTPHIDALAAGGVILDRHYAYKFCTPSRSSLLSGRFPVHVTETLRDPDVPNAGIPYNMTAFPERLRAAGYKTHVVGKWDLGMATPKHTPNGRGFDSSLIYYEHKNDYWSYKEMQSACITAGAAYANLTDLWEDDGPAVGVVAAALENGTFEELLFRDRLLGIVAAHDAADAAAPLFALYTPHVAHCPLQVPKDYLDRFVPLTEGSAAGDEGECSAQTGPGYDAPGATNVYPGFSGNYSCRAMYAASVALLDDVVGALVGALAANARMLDDTLIVFSSDNGGCEQLVQSAGSNHPLRGGKASDFEGGQRVAAFVGGGFVPAAARGAHLAAPLHIGDWYTTFLARGGLDPFDALADAAGLPLVDGADAWPLIVAARAGATGAEGATADAAGAAGVVGAARELPLSSEALVVGDLKLLLGVQKYAGWVGAAFPNASSPARGDPGDMELDCTAGCLFNVSADPTERADLAAARPDDVTRLVARLAALADGFYDNADTNMVDAAACADAPAGVPCACHAAVAHWGGFFGPYQLVDF